MLPIDRLFIIRPTAANRSKLECPTRHSNSDNSFGQLSIAIKFIVVTTVVGPRPQLGSAKLFAIITITVESSMALNLP